MVSFTSMHTHVHSFTYNYFLLSLSALSLSLSSSVPVFQFTPMTYFIEEDALDMTVSVNLELTQSILTSPLPLVISDFLPPELTEGTPQITGQATGILLHSRYLP